MQRNWFDIHLSDKELDKKRHKRMKKAEEFKKWAKFVWIIWTWWWWWNEVYKKDWKIYVIDTYSKITLLK